jgi:2-iminobutanoate/2-iminopropanoate deaminase
VIRRIPGQSPDFPGAVVCNGLLVTSGLVAPSALSAAGTDFPAQADEVFQVLDDVLTRAGSRMDRVLRIEAFLARAEDFPAWHERFTRCWPADPPARTTTVAGMVLPSILIEVQATAHSPSSSGRVASSRQ